MDIELIAGRIESTIAVHKEGHCPVCIAFAYGEVVPGIEGIHFRIGCSYFPIFVDREFVTYLQTITIDTAVCFDITVIVDAESRIVIFSADPEAILREGIVRTLAIAYKEPFRRLRRRLFCYRIVCSSGFCCHSNGGRSHCPSLNCLSLADLLIFSRMVKDIPQ